MEHNLLHRPSIGEMVMEPRTCPPFGRPTYPSHFSANFTTRGFALSRSGEAPTAQTGGFAPFVITLIGFLLAFGGAIGWRYVAAAKMPGLTGTAVAATTAAAPAAAAAPVPAAADDAILFPPAPAVEGVASATLLAPVSPAPEGTVSPDSMLVAPKVAAAKHKSKPHHGPRHRSHRSAE
jgi:hypothetical protein